MDEITTTVRKCARCGKDHADLTFRPFTKPLSVDLQHTSVMGRLNYKALYSHWAMCPSVDEPIVMRVEKVES